MSETAMPGVPPIERPLAVPWRPGRSTLGTAAGLTGLAIAVGALAVVQPLPVLGAFAALGCLALAFAAPVANLLLVLFLTALVGYALQNSLGMPVLPSDGLLAAGLLRAIVVLLGQRLDARRAAVLGLASAFLAATLLQVVHGLHAGWNVRQVGAEGRELLGFATLIVAMPIVADPGGRVRLAYGLAALGLLLGLWGLAQWGLGIHLGENVDAGVRGAQPFATSGAGQLHGGLYGYPVAVVMSVAALFSPGRRPTWGRWVLTVIALTNIACLLLTYERTFWLTTIVTLGYVVAKLERGRRIRAAASLLAAAVVLLGVLATTRPADLVAIYDRVLSLGQTASDNSVRYRVVETQHVLAKVHARPLQGWGLGDTVYWGRPWQGVPARAAWFSHNGYLWVIWKTGMIVAAILFVLLGWAVISRAPPEPDRALRAFRIAAQGGLLVLLLSSVTFPSMNALSITAVMGVLLAVCFAPRQKPG